MFMTETEPMEIREEKKGPQDSVRRISFSEPAAADDFDDYMEMLKEIRIG